MVSSHQGMTKPSAETTYRSYEELRKALLPSEARGAAREGLLDSEEYGLQVAVESLSVIESALSPRRSRR